MKTALVMALGLLLVVSSAFATDTRVMVMGDNNTILLDEANVWLFPSRINYYPDLASIELVGYNSQFEPLDPYAAPGSEGIERIGVNMKFGDEKPYVIGLYLHDNLPYLNRFSPIMPPSHGSYGNETEPTMSNKRADLFYGRKVGNNDFGVRFGYVHSSYENLSATGYDETSFSQYNLEFGLTIKNGLCDIAVGLESFSFTDRITVDLDEDLSTSPNWGGVDDYEPDGNRRFYLRVRHFQEINPTVTVVPHAEFSTGSYKYNDFAWYPNASPDSGYSNQLDQAYKTTAKDFQLGMGMHYTPASSVLAVIDFGLQTSKIEFTRDDHILSQTDSTVTYENSQKWTALPYIKLGFEASVFKWMDVRFGAISFWTKYTNHDVDDALKWVYRYPDNREYLGFGFNWGRFHVDTYANPALFTNGFDFISGNSTEEMNFKISAVYEMH